MLILVARLNQDLKVSKKFLRKTLSMAWKYLLNCALSRMEKLYVLKR